MDDRMKRPWSIEDDRRALELHAAGRSALSIGVALHRSTGAVSSRLSILQLRTRKVTSTVPPAMAPMTSFNPSEPAILHDRVSGKIETWTGDHAADYRKSAITRPDQTVSWRGFAFDGWGDMLGG